MNELGFKTHSNPVSCLPSTHFGLADKLIELSLVVRGWASTIRIGLSTSKKAFVLTLPMVTFHQPRNGPISQSLQVDRLLGSYLMRSLAALQTLLLAVSISWLMAKLSQFGQQKKLYYVQGSFRPPSCWSSLVSFRSPREAPTALTKVSFRYWKRKTSEAPGY